MNLVSLVWLYECVKGVGVVAWKMPWTTISSRRCLGAAPLACSYLPLCRQPRVEASVASAAEVSAAGSGGRMGVFAILGWGFWSLVAF